MESKISCVGSDILFLDGGLRWLGWWTFRILLKTEVGHYELYEKADWKATMELRTMIESNTADGEICYWS